MIETEVNLTTDRLVVRTATADDISLLVSFLIENRKYQEAAIDAGNDLFFTEPFWIEQLARDREALASDHALRLFLFPTDHPDRIIGMIYFDRFAREPLHSCRLTCALDEASVGEGLMSEALFAAIAYMFAKQNFHRVETAFPATDERCERLVEKLGFDIEGKARQYRRFNGKWHDYSFAALINRHWEPPA